MNKDLDDNKKYSANGYKNYKFVAINFISCKSHYRERFEELFANRAHAIDKMPGFLFFSLKDYYGCWYPCSSIYLAAR